VLAAPDGIGLDTEQTQQPGHRSADPLLERRRVRDNRGIRRCERAQDRKRPPRLRARRINGELGGRTKPLDPLAVLVPLGEPFAPALGCDGSEFGNTLALAGGFTGIIEPDEVTLEYLKRARGLSEEEIRRGFLKSDPEAEYSASFEIYLAAVRPMVATPGDPRNGLPVSELSEPVKIDIAYGGSCTGGKMADMDMYAAVLKRAVEQGRRVAPGVHLYLQFGSQKIKEYARSRGYIEIFERAGAELIDPSCGACINAGPGASPSAETVTVSAQNRNFPGRSGPGKLYLASPYVVAASAIAGRIVTPEVFLREREEELVGV
jgi:hypothetical protein